MLLASDFVSHLPRATGNEEEEVEERRGRGHKRKDVADPSAGSFRRFILSPAPRVTRLLTPALLAAADAAADAALCRASSPCPLPTGTAASAAAAAVAASNESQSCSRRSIAHLVAPSADQ